MKIEWYEIERPAGPQLLPDWVKGLHIDWRMQYNSSPCVQFRVHGRLGVLDNEPWRAGPKGRYWREKDGVMEQLWHTGAVTQREDGEWQTTQQEGFGGRTTIVKMDDGRTIHLRGPWFGGHQAGYNEMTTVNDMQEGWRGRPHWWQKMGTFGLYVSDEILILAICRYQPHVLIAMERFHDWGMMVQPYLAEWGMPKRVMQEMEYQKLVAARNTKVPA